MRQLEFEGKLEHSPFAISIRNIAPDSAMRVKLLFEPAAWNGQRLLHLAYFERLRSFLNGLLTASHISLEFVRLGNTTVTATSRWSSFDFATNFASFLNWLNKARMIAQKFCKNPVWNSDTLDRDCYDTIEGLYAVFFEGRLIEKKPNIEVELEANNESLNEGMLKGMQGQKSSVVLSSDCTYTFMNEPLEVGRITQEYTAAEIIAKRVSQSSGKEGANLELLIRGTADTVRTIRPGDMHSAA